MGYFTAQFGWERGIKGIERRLRDEHHQPLHPPRVRARYAVPAGADFVTMCTHERAYLFGHVVNGEMRLNPLGRMATAG